MSHMLYAAHERTKRSMISVKADKQTGTTLLATTCFCPCPFVRSLRGHTVCLKMINCTEAATYRHSKEVCMRDMITAIYDTNTATQQLARTRPKGRKQSENAREMRGSMVVPPPPPRSSVSDHLRRRNTTPDAYNFTETP